MTVLRPLTLASAFVAAGLSGTALAAPAEESVSEVIDVTTEPGTAAKPNLQLRLDEYALPTIDLRFPSGLRVMFQQDNTQPILAITAVTDHGSSSDPQGQEGGAQPGRLGLLQRLLQFTH